MLKKQLKQKNFNLSLTQAEMKVLNKPSDMHIRNDIELINNIQNLQQKLLSQDQKIFKLEQKNTSLKQQVDQLTKDPKRTEIANIKETDI